MSNSEPKPVRLPAHLIRDTTTVGSLNVDEPRYIEQDYVYARDTGELFLHREETFDVDTRQPVSLLGRVGVMNTFVSDSITNRLIPGFVADLRYIQDGEGFAWAPSTEAPSDQEEMNEWLDLMKNLVPIVAIAYLDAVKSPQYLTAGDTRFTDALFHLIELTDAIYINGKFIPRLAKPTRTIRM